MFRYRDKKIATKLISNLKALNLNLRFMHVCGTHQDTLVRFGLEELLKDTGIEIRQGPGCPVCVTTPREIEEAILLARKNKQIASFGDMLKVPGRKKSLMQLRTECAIKIVYSVDDAVKLANERETVFLSVGFETTTPSVASALLNEPTENFSILSCHRLIPPALKALLELGEVKLHGLIEPGHVSTVIGVKPYQFLSRKYKIPQVVAGFEPLDLLIATYMLAKQVKEKRAAVENEYKRLVKWEGNPQALEIMHTIFERCDTPWRGFPVIPNSGLKLRKDFARYDARKKYEDELEEIAGAEIKEPKGCKCSEILRGVADSKDCLLFGKSCTPSTPVGPCMVSKEGNCNIRYRYDRVAMSNN